jgi:hypothetical protein
VIDDATRATAHPWKFARPYQPWIEGLSTDTHVIASLAGCRAGGRAIWRQTIFCDYIFVIKE